MPVGRAGGDSQLLGATRPHPGPAQTLQGHPTLLPAARPRPAKPSPLSLGQTLGCFLPGVSTLFGTLSLPPLGQQNAPTLPALPLSGAPARSKCWGSLAGAAGTRPSAAPDAAAVGERASGAGGRGDGPGALCFPAPCPGRTPGQRPRGAGCWGAQPRRGAEAATARAPYGDGLHGDRGRQEHVGRGGRSAPWRPRDPAHVTGARGRRHGLRSLGPGPAAGARAARPPGGG